MQLHQVRAFVEVATQCHFGRAAEVVHITQPALSQRIRDLERELGVTLFIRTSRSVTLTEAGEALLPLAKRLLTDEDRAVATMRSFAVGDAIHLRIAYWMPGDPKLQTRVAQLLQQRSPSAKVEISFGYSQSNLDRLRADEVDMVFVNLPMYGLDDFEVNVVDTEPFLLALPVGHRLADRGPVDLSDCSGERWILFPRTFNPGQYDYIIDSIAGMTGLAPAIAGEAQAPGHEANVEAVAAGIGIALCARSRSEQLHIDGVTYAPIASGNPAYQLALITRPSDRRTRLGSVIGDVIAELRDAVTAPISSSRRPQYSAPTS